MTLPYSLHANDVIWLICKLGSKAQVFMQITKTSAINILYPTHSRHSVCPLYICQVPILHFGVVSLSTRFISSAETEVRVETGPPDSKPNTSWPTIC